MVQSGEIIWKSGAELAKDIKNGELSPVEVLDSYLDRIKKINPKINAIVTLIEDNAREEAKKAEKRVKEKRKLGVLHGIPVVIKDNIPVKGVRTTYGSKLYENHVPEEDMILVDRLKHAGAIILGKTNMPEFGLVGITDNPVFGVTRNPWDTNKTTGGSSGGSAAAVAAGLCPIAIGNDGGGSIRIPANFCGVFGLKPHLGRIPRYPSLPGWETMSVEGPITRTVEDAAMMMDVMAGPDDRDYLSLPSSSVNYHERLEEDVTGKKFAFSPDLGQFVIDPDVTEVVRNAISSFSDLGYEVEEVKLDLVDMGEDFLNQVISETAAGLEALREEWEKVMYPAYAAFMGLEENLKSVDFVKIQYKRKELWEQVWKQVYKKYDFLLTPVTAVPAFDVEIGFGPFEVNDESIGPTGWLLTFPFNFTGQPASSIPCGFTKENLPVGLQIVGNRFDEIGVLQASRAFEKGLPWKDKIPSL
ncbi:MAG: amidase [Candidatus Hodarchaeales archaeon]|jgi:aspartyl-tRNA(Asn)/glutamyl-tRNA(Gln) amidotransferase subunit A